MILGARVASSTMANSIKNIDRSVLARKNIITPHMQKSLNLKTVPLSKNFVGA
jgi:hypothetical protein